MKFYTVALFQLNAGSDHWPRPKVLPPNDQAGMPPGVPSNDQAGMPPGVPSNDQAGMPPCFPSNNLVNTTQQVHLLQGDRSDRPIRGVVTESTNPAQQKRPQSLMERIRGTPTGRSTPSRTATRPSPGGCVKLPLQLIPPEDGQYVPQKLPPLHPGIQRLPARTVNEALRSNRPGGEFLHVRPRKPKTAQRKCGVCGGDGHRKGNDCPVYQRYSVVPIELNNTQARHTLGQHLAIREAYHVG
jgi:hypothetical protein